MLSEFKKENYAEGLVEVIYKIGHCLKSHFPYDAATDKNELPDDIVFGKMMKNLSYQQWNTLGILYIYFYEPVSFYTSSFSALSFNSYCTTGFAKTKSAKISG